MTDAPISCYHNEDLDKDYILTKRKAEYLSVKKPTIDQIEAIDITGATFESTAKFGSSSITLDVTIVDAPTGHIQVFLDQATVATLRGKTGTYDILMTLSGVVKRVFGGPIEVLAGVTTP